MRHFLFFTCAALVSSTAFAITWEENPLQSSAANNSSGAAPKLGASPKNAKTGPYALLEWNPADLAYNRVRFSGEYVIVDGFAFGGVGEFQQQDKSDWRFSTTAVGVTATQYLESQSLRGPYIKGEINAFGTQFNTKQKNATDQMVYGVGLGMDLGYRFLIGQNFTGGASYGARRAVPDFFATSGNNTQKEYLERTRIWDFRVQLNLGVAL